MPRASAAFSNSTSTPNTRGTNGCPFRPCSWSLLHVSRQDHFGSLAKSLNSLRAIFGKYETQDIQQGPVDPGLGLGPVARLHLPLCRFLICSEPGKRAKLLPTSIPIIRDQFSPGYHHLMAYASPAMSQRQSIVSLSHDLALLLHKAYRILHLMHSIRKLAVRIFQTSRPLRRAEAVDPTSKRLSISPREQRRQMLLTLWYEHR